MIRCKECRLHLRDDDEVVLDYWYWLSHRDCYKGSNIIDRSTYRDIRKKHREFGNVKSPSQ